ncbi:hypothetical protein KKG83_04080 [Candidatus Micrarchaeota archaeon]|nr:hypothetical protein [Candidatus Micrarchaeota archaeon]MBU2476624.1 hypothetical protein [Candidatus Micrarchaeota archaeon]
MKALIEVNELKQDWSPPFQKKKEIKEIEVEEGSAFESNGNGGNVFRLVQIGKDRILVEYDVGYTNKGHVHPVNRQLWIARGEKESFSQLWGNDGVTKTLTLMELK